MTPRLFSFLLKRHEQGIKRADRRAGGVIAALYNLNSRTEESDPVQEWWDYFTEWKPEPESQTDDEMFQAMMAFTKQREGLPH